jgi:hypothetical protein
MGSFRTVSVGTPRGVATGKLLWCGQQMGSFCRRRRFAASRGTISEVPLPKGAGRSPGGRSVVAQVDSFRTVSVGTLRGVATGKLLWSGQQMGSF